jgi:3-isopropylmalate dehydrogenase
MIYKIVLMPGDGIGPELTETTLEVLNAVQDQHNLGFRFINVDAGDACYARTGVALPTETIQAVRDHSSG